MVYGDELEVEAGQLFALTLCNDHGVWLDAVFFEFGLNECKCESRTEQRNVALEFEEVRNPTDVVFVTVGEHDTNDVVEAVPQVTEVRENNVDTRLMFFWKEHPDVNDEDFAVDFEAGHVSTDFADSA
jgi:hypothetical protein